MGNKYFKAFLLVTFLIVSVKVAAQVPPDPDPPGTPIDGSILGLLALGVGYAIKKIGFQNKK